MGIPHRSKMRQASYGGVDEVEFVEFVDWFVSLAAVFVHCSGYRFPVN